MGMQTGQTRVLKLYKEAQTGKWWLVRIEVNELFSWDLPEVRPPPPPLLLEVLSRSDWCMSLASLQVRYTNMWGWYGTWYARRKMVY